MTQELFETDRFERIALPDADVELLRRLELHGDPQALLEELIATISWRQDPITLWGKQMLQPRLVAWHGDPGLSYTYSGLRHEPQAWTSTLRSLKSLVETAAGTAFNSVLLNYYRDRNDSMGLHSDDEPELGDNPVIASLSLGAERVFVLKHKTRRDLRTFKLALPSESLLVMKGPTQANWKHGLPKARHVCGPRVNLTFRTILGPLDRS